MAVVVDLVFAVLCMCVLTYKSRMESNCVLCKRNRVCVLERCISHTLLPRTHT